MTDKPQMPYTEAVLCEIMRCGNIAPLGLWHTATKPVTINGITIPANTMINGVFMSVLKGEHWENGSNFDPERFLNEDGTLRKDEHLIPFSMGKRVCLGETLARTELFLFFTGILQLITS